MDELTDSVRNGERGEQCGAAVDAIMAKERRRSMLKLTVGIALLAAFAFGIYKCPIKLIFGVDCPGCGLTRAFWSALRLDFKAAFAYHPLFPLVGAEALYVILYKPINKRIRVNKKAELIVAAATLILLIIVYIIRQFL